MLLPSRYSFRLVSRKKAKEIKLALNNDIKIRILNDPRYSKSATAEPIAESKPTVSTSDSNEKVVDGHKRGFLKYAGVAGVSALAYLAFPKKAEALIMGSTPTSNIIGVKNAANIRIDPATETTVSGIKSKTDHLNFDGSNNLQIGGDVGIQNASNITINPATEETLALMKAKTDLLTFDGSNNLLTATTGAASAVGVKDTTGTPVNPATEDSNVYLRRIVKLMESQATVDGANRQRVTVDAITGALTLATVTTVGTVSSITGGTITTITNPVPLGNLATLASYDQRQFIDGARNAYANSIRQNLIFS
jgi:predicted RNA-binding protein Jag